MSSDYETEKAGAGPEKRPRSLSPNDLPDERGPLAKLPIEWLVQVIYWLPTQFIFTIMCVNREWECACRYVIRTRESLELRERHSGGYTREPVDERHAVRVCSSINTKRYDAMVSSLMAMEWLTSFRQQDSMMPCERFDDFYARIMKQNSSTLVQVICPDQLHDDGSISYPRLKKLRCGKFDATTAARLCSTLKDLSVSNRIMIDATTLPLMSLKRLETGFCRGPDVDEFILRNAASLESIRCCKLPGYNFPKLKELFQVPEQETFLPSLQRLEFWLGHENVARGCLKKLPLHQIRHLESYSINKEEGKEQIVDALKDLTVATQVQRIRITILKSSFPDGFELPDLFANMHLIEKAEISIMDYPEIGRSWVSSLVRNNPHLRELILHGIPVSDEDMILLSALSNLSVTRFGDYPMRRRQGFTNHGIRYLLRRASRHKIIDFEVTGDEETFAAVDSEFDLIEKESNITFIRSKLDAKCFSSGSVLAVYYRIHRFQVSSPHHHNTLTVAGMPDRPIYL
jgi:hypothetical protein